MKKRKVIVLISSIAFLCFWAISCSLQQPKPAALIVSAAGVYRDVLAELEPIYKQKKPNVTITYNIAGSGLLRKQIEQGVPVDIYIPAIELEMDKLQSSGFVIPETRLNLTKNKLVLIVPKESSIHISNFQDLMGERVKKVALGKETIAAGIYTKQVLTFFRIYDNLKNKGIFAEEDIRQVLKVVETKNADAGITFLTEAKLSNKVKIAAIAPENSHIPIVSPIAVLQNCDNVPEAKEFIQFLKSNEIALIFEKYGFTVVK